MIIVLLRMLCTAGKNRRGDAKLAGFLHGGILLCSGQENTRHDCEYRHMTDYHILVTAVTVLVPRFPYHYRDDRRRHAFAGVSPPRNTES